MSRMTDEECRRLLEEWHLQYCDGPSLKFHPPEWFGFRDLGPSVRGITEYRGSTDHPRYGVIAISSRLKAGWRVKATLWHEFCHHDGWASLKYEGHDEFFDHLVRRKKGLWLLCSLSRLLPI